MSEENSEEYAKIVRSCETIEDGHSSEKTYTKIKAENIDKAHEIYKKVNNE